MGIVAVGSRLRKPWQGTGTSPGSDTNSRFTSPHPAMPQAPVTHTDARESGELIAAFGDFSAMSGVQSTRETFEPGLVNSGAVFSSQDFEDKLLHFAVAEAACSGRAPADEALKAKAKEISGMEVWQAETTEADDPALLVRFKALVVGKVRAVLSGQDDNSPRSWVSTITSPSPAARTPERGMDAIDPGLLPDLSPAVMGAVEESSISLLPVNVHVAISEQRLDEILRDI